MCRRYRDDARICGVSDRLLQSVVGAHRRPPVPVTELASREALHHATAAQLRTWHRKVSPRGNAEDERMAETGCLGDWATWSASTDG